jgi:hypothetical protein
MDFFEAVSKDATAILKDEKFLEFLRLEVEGIEKAFKSEESKGKKIRQYAKEVIKMEIAYEYVLIVNKTSKLSASKRNFLIEIVRSAINQTLKYYGKQKDSNCVSHDTEGSV